MKPQSLVKFSPMLFALTVLLQNTLISPGRTESSVLPEESQSMDNVTNKGVLKFIAPLSKRPYPGERSPGGSKDNCPDAAVPLTVLMPSLPNGRAFDIWGQTLQERPLIWVYVPYGSEDKRPNDKKNDFGLQLEIREDTKGKPFVERRVPLPAKAKIMSISLPADYQLEVGKNYEVQIRANCIKANPQKVSFWVQRVAMPTGLSQAPMPSRDRVKLLAERGIWLDTLTEVVNVNAAPTLSAEWQTFVQESLGWDLQERTKVGREEKAKMEKILKEPIN